MLEYVAAIAEEAFCDCLYMAEEAEKAAPI